VKLYIYSINHWFVSNCRWIHNTDYMNRNWLASDGKLSLVTACLFHINVANLLNDMEYWADFSRRWCWLRGRVRTLLYVTKYHLVLKSQISLRRQSWQNNAHRDSLRYGDTKQSYHEVQYSK